MAADPRTPRRPIGRRTPNGVLAIAGYAVGQVTVDREGGGSMTARELGISGVGLEAGDHVCGFYFGERERDAILLPYLRNGLRDGDKCLAVVDSTTPAEVSAGIGADGHATDCLRSRQLEIWGTEDTYLRTGVFSPDLMIEFWEEQVGAATEDGRFDFVRVVGEMSWLERAAPARELVVAYESWADRFALQHAQAVLCLYDVQRVGGGLLMDLFKTHPKVLLNGIIVENPHHLSGDEFASAST